tara:strand:+ start:10304 stop:11515 length:1212 start_codon:yes stop_codon:yes gene_type:complete
MQQIYTLGIYFFSFLVKVYSFLDGKTKKLIDGHVSTWKIIENVDSEAFVWFHVASLGEFEQGRPLIESLKVKYPDQKILVTFFSPSGYEVKKKYSHADLVLYLPFDTPKNARRFLSKVSIKVAVFVKYEFWFNYLNELQNNDIPIIYVSSLFRKGQLYFKSNWMVGVFRNINHFFVQNEESRLILSSNGINNATVSGDTRLDSVVLTAGEKWIEKKIENSLNGRPVVIFGSTWSGDHTHIVSFIKKHCSNYQYIIAPHEINEKEISELENSIEANVSLYSTSEKFTDVMIIDSIGILKYLYRYADVAYIGGGFNSGIHNTLEPLSYGIPVLFGSKNHIKFTEAKKILELNLGAVVNPENFNQKLELYLDSPELRGSIKQKIEKYIENNKGATSKVVDMLTSIL